MKYGTDRSYADPEQAARKLLEIANSVGAVQDGRIHIEKINAPFLFVEKATAAEYKAGLDLAIARGWLQLHERAEPMSGSRQPAPICSRETRGLPVSHALRRSTALRRRRRAAITQRECRRRYGASDAVTGRRRWGSVDQVWRGACCPGCRCAACLVQSTPVRRSQSRP
jgi:hypothetical protein